MRFGRLDNAHLSNMTKETYKKVMQALSEAHPSNTSNDFSVSIHDYHWCGIDRCSLLVFSNLPTSSFVETTLKLFLSIAEVFNVSISLRSKHGVPVVKFY